MNPLVRLEDIHVAYGDQTILEGAVMSVEAGERVCLIGRNGAGKSTTLKLVSGLIEPDEGEIRIPGSVRIAMLRQELAEASTETVTAFVEGGMSAQMERIAEYQRLAALGGTDKPTLLAMDKLEREILAGGGWSVDAQVAAIITQLGLPATQQMRTLSGGWRRRAALARALVSNPDLLLLDEPTNHLDIGTIEWLEQEIRRYDGAVLFVTHDRAFVERVATRIIDLDRGRLRSFEGGYRDYLRRKQEIEHAEDIQNKEFDKKLAQEETWIRQGVKARETRNEGRVRSLEDMREERAARVPRARSARIHVNESGDVSGRKVIDVRNVRHGFGDRLLLDNFSLRVMRGDRIGIVGNNGVGKSTLLRLLLGELEPDSGSIKLGTHLEIAYFDQLRRELDTSKTVADIIGEGRDYIFLNGRRKHVVAYLTDFLFSAKRAMTRISALSGGERNRVILAKLFTRPANLLVLDEPTNDLDVETLEALESRLKEYSGTLLVVSHDRHFLDATVTSTLVFEDDGGVRKYAGNFSDWMRKHRKLAVQDDPDGVEKTSSRPREKRASSGNTKLSYKLQRELDALPGQIDSLEQSLAEKQAAMSAPDFYNQAHEAIEKTLADIASQQAELDSAIERWAELAEQAEAAAK